MPAFSSLFAWVIAGCLMIMALILLRKTLGKLVLLSLRTCVTLLGLWLIQPLAQTIGITLGVNLLNAAVISILGMPGFALLLMLPWAAA